MFKRNMVILISIIFVLSVINAMDEEYSFGGAVAVSLLACLPPFLATNIVGQLGNKTTRPFIMKISSYLIGLIGIVMYTLYALNGKTNPDTAAHMHVFAFPVLYLIVSILIILAARLAAGFTKSNS